MPNPNPNQSGLKSQHPQAPDVSEPTATIGVRLELSTIAWLNTMPEGRSLHVRQALRLYQKTFKNPTENP